MTPAKVLENRVRRVASRRRLRVIKSRRRDPRATDYGRYKLTDEGGNIVVGGDGLGLTLSAVADYLQILNVLDRSTETMPTDFAVLIEKWDLGSLSNELDDLLKKLRDADRPESALKLGHALVAFVNEFPRREVVDDSE